MPFNLSFLLFRRRVEYFDATVFGRHIYERATFVKYCAVGRCKARVELHFLFDHANVPYLRNSVAICRDNAITPDVETDRIDGVVMPVESLDTLTRTDVPHGDGLITGAGGEDLCVGLPRDRVDGINVTAVGKPRLVHVQVPHLYRVIHRGGEQEVSSVVEGHLPHRLPVLGIRMGATGVHKVPDLDCAISRSGCEEVSTRMERATANPVLMALSGHNEVPIWHGPQLPRRIVTGRGDNVLFGVVAQTRDWHQVALECFEVAQVGPNSFERLVEGRVKSFALGNRSRLASHFESSLSAGGSLLFLRRLLAGGGSNL